MIKYKVHLSGQEKTLGFKLKIFSGKHEVYLDGQKIGQFENAKEAKAGKDFKLNDFNTVNFRYALSGFNHEVNVALNGEDLEESANHPKYRNKSAFALMIILMALNLGIGFIGAYNTFAAISEAGYGAYNIFIGCLYLLAIFMFKRSDPFLGICLTLCVYSLDTVVTFISMAGNPAIGGAVVMRIMFFTILIKGLKSSWPSFKEIFVKN